MIQLFKTPNIKINTNKYSSLLHDKVVQQFEEQFAEYVGAKYACSFNSATNAIQILLSIRKNVTYTIPSVLPLVVGNAILHSGNKIAFCDNIDWVGDSYLLAPTIIDSAQKVEKYQYFKETNSQDDVIIYSFYPTKPVGGCDGGMIVSNNKYLIDYLKILTLNGCINGQNSWDRKQYYIGYKAYMNSMQAEIALRSLKNLGTKKDKLYHIRERYNRFFGIINTSDHLYRINVRDNTSLVTKAAENGIVLGIHYNPLHKTEVFKSNINLPLSETIGKTTISLPFHEDLKKKDIDYVCKFIEKNS